MDSMWVKWAINGALCLVAAVDFTLYGIVFRQLGGARLSIDYILALLTNPLFLLGIALAFVGTFLRMWMFTAFGINKSVILPEAAVVLTVFLAWIVFREPMGIKFFLGTALILGGVYILS